ncbi:MAG: hypothetical protein R3Y61_00080 [Rikenellaceae bacterium]
MKDNKDREFIPFDEVMDETFGKSGTPQRADYDKSIELWADGLKAKEIREAKPDSKK